MSTNPSRVIPNYESCIDCGACEVACQRTWELPTDTQRIKVVRLAHGTDEESQKPMQCYNCTDAPCIDVCPTDALFYRDDGTVRVKGSLCIGCHYCGVGCPFGAPNYPDEIVPEADEMDPVGHRGDGLMDKCTSCEPRTEQDLAPACASECPTDALLFGTVDELEQQVEENNASQPFSQGAAEVVFGDDADRFTG